MHIDDARDVSDRPVLGIGPTHFEYQPWLDGLRAIAVIGVLVFHHFRFDPLEVGAWTGGFLGVDIFFVLSGYLITSLLLTEHTRTGRIGLGAFWIRRARRLLPALLVMVTGVLALAQWVLRDRELFRLRGEMMSALFYVANWYHLGHGGAVGHVWSLAVEEQWYLVWPILFVALLRVTRARASLLITAITILVIGSFVWSLVVLAQSDEQRVYYGTDTRSHELLAGALLAVVLAATRTAWSSRARRAADATGIAALAVVVVLFWSAKVDAQWLHRFGYPLISALIAAVIVAGVRGRGAVARVLGIRWLRMIGVVSYGLYLFHWPVYWWLRERSVGFDGAALFVLRVGVTAAFATVSYWLVERPIRRGALPGLRFAAATITAMVVIVTLLFVVTTSNVPGSSETRLAARLRAEADAADPDSTRVLIAGDSTTLPLAKSAPHEIAAAVGSVVDSNCGLGGGLPMVGGQRLPVSYSCARLVSQMEVATEAFEPDVVVLMLGAELALDRDVDGEVLRYGTTALEAHVDERLDAARAALTIGGARFFITSPPCNTLPGVENAERSAWLGGVFERWADARGFELLDLAGLQCDGGMPATIDGTPMFAAGELTESGAIVTWDWLLDSTT
jgi:peptidoglycan/LPS O-acetylase OafA/YrhL